MTSTTKNIVAGVLAVAAILGVAALFVSVTRSRGSREGEVEKEEEERAVWGRSLEERDVPQVESEGDNIVVVVEKGLAKELESEAKISPNEIHGHERKLWVRHEIEEPDERPAPHL